MPKEVPKFKRSVVFYWLEDPGWPEWDRMPITSFEQTIEALLWVKDHPQIRHIWLTGPVNDPRLSLCVRLWNRIFELGQDNGRLGRDLEFLKWLIASAVDTKEYPLRQSESIDVLYSDRVGC